MSKQKRYEYSTISLPEGRSSWADELSDFAKDGWRLKEFVIGVYSAIAIFEREVPE